MARLASQIKMGFYKTPTIVVDQLKSILKIHPKARLLDTCCGEGEALSIVASNQEAATYGMELDRERFDKAKKVLDHVVWGDSLYELRTSAKAFTLLWLNPPYDLDEGDYTQQRERLEVRFLQRHWSYLADGGVLVFIIPFGTLKKVSAFFLRRSRRLVILSFPSKEFDQFKQVVLICEKGRPKKSDVEQNIETLAFATGLEVYKVPDKLPATETFQSGYYDVPEAVDTDRFYYLSARLDPQEAIPQVKESPVWSRVARQTFPPPGHARAHPLMPLREGHLAMLLASGMMNGEVVGEDGQKLIVKGSVKKKIQESSDETETEKRHIQTDSYQITVRAICFDPLEILTIT
ncbi:MAG: class I SAM-dependent methyltransferase [Deltaproteobacteria bacterium]|jgi:hypothetical protein|nr:class I SAM-dependent methyltransferase [Deltaproteobacteria bacterium]